MSTAGLTGILSPIEENRYETVENVQDGLGIRYAQPRAMGRKVSDEWTVPLCATHHRALHTVGDEEKWWSERGINPIIHAGQLWRERWGEVIQQPSRARELISPGGQTA